MGPLRGSAATSIFRAALTPAPRFTIVAAELSAADVIYGNLEGPLAGADDPAPIPHKPGWVHSDPAMAAGLKAAGFTFMSCASNVAYPPMRKRCGR